ncbi:MlaE family lipid ABC transporter permease subunit [Aristophania vespae]|uniref:MlaE family lipid ABC transporter permease subunit n=1 Tax=Aristophania vespae TaxID=2697033 RepID=A0A6P1NFX2_9PROT|nr:ABC transporter permease [Aristophania vespae]QHI96173.1 MlaE family lipid ABC transporter permease subunit [Aristophania vespae]UMM63961.1 Intermembrane phospholipid transport system permease protein MlaE [Aristophania vespae]
MTLALLPFIALGRFILSGIKQAGSVALFGLKALMGLIRPPFYFGTFARTLVEIGFLSLPVVALTAIFAGAVIALQSYTGFRQYHAQNAIASIVVLSITRELGPVLAGLMVAGRVGAALSAQIGTMRVTNQIDALSTLSTNPIKYLVTPRLLAATLALPVLVLIADILGIFGGFTVSVVKLGLEPETYINATMTAIKSSDVFIGLVKAATFGFLIALLGCYHGYKSRGGAEGVGSAATATVVSTSILLLLFDYILTDLFFTI